MRSEGNAWGVISAIAGVICAILAAVQLHDRWWPSATPPDPPPPVEGTPEVVSTPGEETEEAGSPTPSGDDGVRLEAEPTTPRVEQLINDRVVPSGSVPVMAIALDGDSTDVEVLEAALAQASSAEMRVVSGFFKPAFRERGFLRAVYDGDTEALTSSGALAAVDQILVGRVERACRATGQFDSDLVTCDVRLYFKVIDRHGAVANAGQVAVAGAGFSENAARDRAVDMLVEQHRKQIISPE